MIYKIAEKAKPKKEAKLHVALLDAAGAVEIHEERLETKARERYKMLCYQVQLNALKGKHGYTAYMGEQWPPPEPTAEEET